MTATTNTTSTQTSTPWLDDISKRIIPELTEGDGSLQWGRLITEWSEKNPKGTLLKHTYAACVDGETGGLFNDCNLSLIFKKCLTQLLVRPFHSIAKTIYHASFIPLFVELPDLYYGKKPIKQLLNTAVLTFTDIIRTPLYGIALIAASAYVLARAIFDPATLYNGRKLIGEIEEEANRGLKHTDWTLTHCFQPYPIEVLKDYEIQDFSLDTLYPSNSPIDKQLTNFARSKIRHKQKRFDIFSCSQLAKGQPYTSPILLGENCSSEEKSLPIYANIL